MRVCAALRLALAEDYSSAPFVQQQRLSPDGGSRNGYPAGFSRCPRQAVTQQLDKDAFSSNVNGGKGQSDSKV